MDLLEDFVIALLNENIIENYTADTEKVRAFYDRNYKEKTKLKFFPFTLSLWTNWYVLEWSNEEVIFDTNWINYFKRLEEDKSLGRNYLTNTKCLLCDVAYNNSDENHSNSESHKIRLQYVNQKKKFTESDTLKVQITQINNGLRPLTLKIQHSIMSDINVTISIKNNTKQEVNILDIIVVNPLIKNVNLSEDFDKGILLGPKKHVNLNLHAYFENSVFFAYPIVIVTGVKGSNTKTYHLKEIIFEITSEFSFLATDEKYVKTQLNAVGRLKDMLDTIIPGEQPPLSSEYKETLQLRQFKIPPHLNNKLMELIESCPQFVEGGPSGRAFYPHFSAFLNIYPGINANNYYSNMETLLHIEENQKSIDIRNYDMRSALEFKKGSTLYELTVPGLGEDRPSILIFDKIYVKESKNSKTKYEGIVHRVLEETIHLGLNRRFNDIFLNKKEYHIEFGFNRRSIKVEKQALFLAESHGIVPCLFPSRIEIQLLTNQPSLHFSNRVLNEAQKTAVNSILMPKNYPFVIFGPPGTGKTVTVVEAAYQLWKNYPNSRVLICAPSNAAANEVAYRLVDIIPKSDIFRLIGNYYSSVVEKGFKKIIDIINVEKDKSWYMPSMEDLLKRRILITTIITAARLVNGGTPPGHFTHVFIDESGFATETQTLIPIAGILSSAEVQGKLTGQIILTGDPKQLGPRVHSSFAQHCGYGTSLLERLLKTCDVYARTGNDDCYDNRSVTKLVKNYRSHETILKVPNDLFYHGQLQAEGNEFTHTFEGWEHLKNAKFPVIFHHVEGEDVREKTSPSFFNVQEIEVVVDYLKKIISNRVRGRQIIQDDVGVITPYRKQVEKIRNACSKTQWNSLLVGSVEQFQGKERMIIVISTVRSKNVHKYEQIDQKCQLGFLKNPKRFNVALTRAKALLIVIGNANVLKTDNNWSSFIKYCLENNSVAGKRFTLSDNEE